MIRLHGPTLDWDAKGTRLFWFMVAASGMLRIWAALDRIPNGLFDDAYITLRYSANLAQGLGLVFNPGEHVLGTTSPLFTAILATGARVLGQGRLETLAVTVGILSSLFTLYFCAKALTKAGIPQSVQWAFLCVVAFLPSFIANSVSGMETPLVLFLMSLSLYFYTQERFILLSITGVLLFLGRIDTGIWLLGLALALLSSMGIKHLGQLVRPLLMFLTPVTGWLIFLKEYFGSIVPQSVVGKAVSHGAFTGLDMRYALQFLSAFVPAQKFGSWGLLVIGLVFASLFPSAREMWRDYPKVRPVLIFFPLYAGIFLFARAPLFSWYLIPPKWAFYLLAVFAIWWFLSRLPADKFSWSKPTRVMGATCLLLLALGIRSVARQDENENDLKSNPLVLSSYIEKYLTPGGSVFLEHIGLVGYRCNCKIYDSMGLVTPETTRLRRRYGSGWLARAAREYRADIVILYQEDRAVLFSGVDENSQWFRGNYVYTTKMDLGDVLAFIYFLKDSSHLRSQTDETLERSPRL